MIVTMRMAHALMWINDMNYVIFACKLADFFFIFFIPLILIMRPHLFSVMGI